MDERDTRSETPAPMKILFICGAGTVSGREIATLNLIEGLRRRGHDVRCVASTWGNGQLVLRLKSQGIKHISLPLGFISKTLSWSALWMTLDQLRRVPQLWLGFRRYRQEFEPDIVVQTNFHHVFLLWPLLNPSNTFFHVHDGFPTRNFYRKLSRFLNRRLCAFIAVSQYIAESLVRLGVPPDKVCYVHNGVAIDELGPPDTSSSVLNRSDGAAAPVVIGIVGQIGEWKGHDDLIAALGELRKAEPRFACTIFGSGEPEYVCQLKERIEQQELTTKISHAGFIDKARDIYQNIDICVVPSRFQEPFGMVAAEAAYFGVPVVATRRGGLPEIVVDGVTGYLVDAEAPLQLMEKLRLLVQNQALREQLGGAARAHAQRHFTREQMAARMEAIFSRALKPEHAPERQAGRPAEQVARQEKSY